MKTLFKHGNGRLKTLRITFIVFALMMIGLAMMYKMGKSVDQIFVQIDHVFEAEKPVPEPKPDQETKQEQDPKDEPKTARMKQAVEQKPEPESSKETPAGLKKKDIAPKPGGESSAKKKAVVEKLTPKGPARTAEAGPAKNRPRNSLEKMEPVFNPRMIKNAGVPAVLELASGEYFELYRQWQTQGESLLRNPEEKSKRIGLKILNLEKFYDLFQMKVVGVKGGSLHIDLEDFSRVIQSSLSEFSSTCFIVAEPWKKWGKELEESGFRRTDNIEVRYYTYDFVRNAIYARAMKAFEWSLEQAGLPGDTDPSEADVLGTVYAVNQKGGGSFGVFVPTQVDFDAGDSVRIDALACFQGEKDITALNRAGIL